MSLMSLPTELIESVASHLDLSDSCSLRLVSTSLREQSLHVFRDRFFRTRLIQWTRQELDQLCEISAHADFGTALQCLNINATPKHSASLWQLRKRISEADAVFNEFSSVSFKSELQDRYIEEEKEAKNVSVFFNETRYDQKCMQIVFEKIRRLDSIVFGYEGMEKKYGKFGRRYCESSQHEMSRPFVSTMAAIADSGIHVKNISIHEQHKYGAVGIGRLESLAPSLRTFDTAFEQLETLHLDLRDWRYPDTGFELESTKAPFVVRFLAKARNVKDLRLSCYSSLDDDLIGDMARHSIFAKLLTCKLAHFRVHKAPDLVQLLTSSSSTLSDLSLSHMVLRDAQVTWADLLCHLATSGETLQSLEHMKLTKLFTKTGSKVHFNDGTKPDELVVGNSATASNWRHDLLAHTDRLSESTSGPAWHLAAVAYPFVGMRT